MRCSFLRFTKFTHERERFALCVCMFVCFVVWPKNVCLWRFIVRVIPAFCCSRRGEPQPSEYKWFHCCWDSRLHVLSSMHSAFSLLCTHARTGDTNICVPRSGAILVKCAIEYETDEKKKKNRHTAKRTCISAFSLHTKHDKTRRDKTKDKRVPKTKMTLQLQVSPQLFISSRKCIYSRRIACVCVRAVRSK